MKENIKENEDKAYHADEIEDLEYVDGAYFVVSGRDFSEDHFEELKKSFKRFNKKD